MIVERQVSRTRLPAWALRLVLILNLSIGLSYVGLWLMQAQGGLFWRADFSAFYTGWAIVRDGQGAHLYDLDVQARYQREILGGRSFAEGLLPYGNPPYATLPFVPLAWLPRTTAFWIWTLGQVALLVWLLRLLRSIAEDWAPHERRLLLAAVIAFPPLLTSFLLGAFSLFLLICLLQFYRTLKGSREAHSGLWLVLGTVKMQAMVLPGLLLLAARRWRALASALLIGGMLALLASLVLGWRIWLDFLAVLRVHTTYFGTFGVDPAKMYNFKGTLALLLGNQQQALINQISTVGLIAAAGATVLLWCGAWRPEDPTFELRMALTLLLGLLFSPHLNPHDGLMLVAPALLFYIYLRRRNLARSRYAAVILSCPLLFLISEFTVGGSLGVRVPVVVMVVLAVWMIKALRDEQRAPRAAELLGQHRPYADAPANREWGDVQPGGEIR